MHANHGIGVSFREATVSDDKQARGPYTVLTHGSCEMRQRTIRRALASGFREIESSNRSAEASCSSRRAYLWSNQTT
jgi:hypothetical protein